MLDGSADNESFNGQSAAILAAKALSDMEGLSYEEYFRKVDEMIELLKQHWQLEQRVKALKVAIQLAKLLANSSQIKLYPRKYKMITGTLDQFGQMIYERIQARAKEELANGGGENNFVADPRELAKETCRNWFLKIASIRELVPRFYAELAILKSCEILLRPNAPGVISIEQQFYLQSLRRLSKTAWGFGDPIVAVHARLYLCRVAFKLIDCSEGGAQRASNNLFEVVLTNIRAATTVISQLEPSSVFKLLQVQAIDICVFFEILSSALQGLVSLVAENHDLYAEPKLSESATEQISAARDCLSEAAANDKVSILSRNILLHATFKGVPEDIIAGSSGLFLDCFRDMHAKFTKMRKNCSNINELQATTASFYYSVGSFLVALDTSDTFRTEAYSECRDAVSRTVDSIMNDLREFELQIDSHVNPRYLRCFCAWFSYTNQYGSKRETDQLLEQFVHLMKRDRQHLENYGIITELFKVLFSNKRNISEFSEIFTLKNFPKLFELLRRDDHKFETSKWILETMRANIKLSRAHRDDLITDRGTISSLLKLFTIINDSLSLLAADEDIVHISEVVTYFLDRIAVQDYREHLNFFSRCRSLVGNLTPVLEYLARRALKFALEIRNGERKRSSRQDFLNGCLAFTFITVPALQDPSARLELLIDGLELALNYMSLSLADYYVKQALVNVNQQCQDGKRAETAAADRAHIVAKYQPEMTGGRARNESQVGRNNRLGGGGISKKLADQTETLLKLVVKHQDHIDLRHKLFLANLLRQSFCDYGNLLDCLKHLIMVEGFTNEDNAASATIGC